MGYPLGDFTMTPCFFRASSASTHLPQPRRAIEELMIEWGLAVGNARTGMVYSETDGLGPSVMRTIEAKMAEAELAEKSFRTTIGKNGKAARGLYPSGSQPYGYRWSGGPNSQLVIDDQRATVVRRIFTLAAEGVNRPEIARRLQMEGSIPTSRGVGSWGAAVVHSIIKNRVYIGRHE